MEIVSVVFGAETVAYAGSGAVLNGWPVVGGQVGPVSLADIAGNGLDEIFWGCADQQLWANRADGTALPGWPPPLGGSGYTPHIADLDVGGDLEIITLDSPSAAIWRLFAYHHDGSPLAGFPFLFEGPSPQFAAVGDVDGDGVPEIVVLTDWYKIQLLSATGQVEHSFAVEGILSRGAAPALGDIDGDEIPEIVLLMNGIVHCYNGDGTACDGWPRYWPYGGGGGTFWIGNNGPVIGDVDGDLYPDVVITLQTAGVGTTGEVRVHDRWGNMHPHFPKRINIGSGAVPAIADVDLDGRNKIVVTGSYWDGISGYFDKVWVYDLHGSNYGPIDCGQLAGGPRHLAYYPTPTLAAPGIDLYVRACSAVAAEPGDTVQISVEVGNHGSVLAASVALTTSLDGHLVYVSDTSGVVPVVDGDRIAWALPPAAHPFHKRFTLQVHVPSQAAYGTRYPVDWQISSSGPKADATDNVALTEVLVAHLARTYIPLVLRASP